MSCRVPGCDRDAREAICAYHWSALPAHARRWARDAKSAADVSERLWACIQWLWRWELPLVPEPFAQ